MLKALIDKSKLLLWIIPVVALSVRLIYLVQLERSPLSALSSMDTDFYLFQADKILAGNWLGDEVFFQSGFLYPYVLAFFRLLSGNSLLPVKIAQIVLDSLSALLVCVLARRFFGARAGWIAGLAYAFYGPFIAGSVQPLIDLPIMMPLLAGLTLFYHSRDREKYGLMFVSGLLIGIAVVTRPYLLPLILLIFIDCLRRDGKGRLLHNLKLPLVAMSGLLLVLGSVAVRNKMVGNEWVLTGAGGGLVFYVGNYPDATGAFHIPKGLGIADDPLHYARSSLLFPAQQLGHPVTWSEASRFWFGKGLEFWEENPKAALRITLKKAGLCFNNYENEDNFDFNYLKTHISWLRLPWPGFGLIAPFGILGMFLNRRRFQELIMPYSLVLLVSISQIMILVYTRHRYILAAILIFFASSSMVTLWDRWSAGRRRHVCALLSGVIIFGVFTFWPAGMADNRYKSALNLARGLWKEGRVADAYGSYAEALELNPNFPEGARDFAIALASQGENVKARAVLSAMIDRASSFREGHQIMRDLYKGEPPGVLVDEYRRAQNATASLKETARLAHGYFSERRFLEARETVQNALQRYPDSGELLGLLAYAEDHMGDFNRAAELYLKADSLMNGGTQWAGRREVALGLSFLIKKDLKAAEEAFRKAIVLSPESAEAHYGLGVALKKSGRLPGAVNSYRMSIRFATHEDRWVERAKEELGAIEHPSNGRAK